jgi:preprotein translocase subunit YajC
MLPILLIIPVLYFVMIRPQQKRQKQWQADAGRIKAGDRVTTAGGIRGIILSIKDDVIVIRVAPDGIKLEVAKNAIASVTTQDGISGS